METIKKSRILFWASAFSALAGFSTVGVGPYLLKTEVPQIYREYVQTKYEMNHLNSAKLKIEKLISKEFQQKPLLALEEIIKEQKIKLGKLETNTNFQEYCELKTQEDKKIIASWFGGIGLSILGYLGIAGSLIWNAKIRKREII